MEVCSISSVRAQLTVTAGQSPGRRDVKPPSRLLHNPLTLGLSVIVAARANNYLGSVRVLMFMRV